MQTSVNQSSTQIHMPVQVKLSEIIKLILQFLQQQNLTRSFDCLQKQSKVTLNFINKNAFEEAVNTSNWQNLFKQLNNLSLGQDLLFDIYQLIIDDLLQKDGFGIAKLLFDKLMSPISVLEFRERKLRIQYICQNPSQKAMYHKPVTSTRRQNIINRVLGETHQQVQESRLLTLITSALKYQGSKGLITPNLSYSLFSGKTQSIQNQVQQMMTKVDKILRYNEQSKITCLQYSNKGAYIALGSVDGLIELYEPLTYTLDTQSLRYQSQGIMLFHDQAILGIKFNATDEMLASIDAKNTIKIWNMSTGRLLRKLDYGSTVGCFCWGIDSSQIFVGHSNVQVFGVRGMGLLGEFVGAGGMGGYEYLVELAISRTNALTGGQLFTFSQNESIRKYNLKTQEQISRLSLSDSSSSSCSSSQLVKYMIQTPKESSSGGMLFHVCSKKTMTTINQNLQQISKHDIDGSGDLVELVNIAIAKIYIYEVVAKNGKGGKGGMVFQVRHAKNRRILYSKQVDNEVAIMEVHPLRNLLAIYSCDHLLTFLRP